MNPCLISIEKMDQTGFIVKNGGKTMLISEDLIHFSL